jgi:hypothetical protein
MIDFIIYTAVLFAVVLVAVTCWAWKDYPDE